jgi:hypothetical protein
MNDFFDYETSGMVILALMLLLLIIHFFVGYGDE